MLYTVPTRKPILIPLLALLFLLGSAGCGGGSLKSTPPEPNGPLDDPPGGVVITHPNDFYIYIYDRSLKQVDISRLVFPPPYFQIEDTWNYSNQTKGSTPFVSVQSEDGGRLHVFWEIGRHGTPQDANTFQSKLAANGLSSILSLGTAEDQKTSSYMPKKMNFGLSGTFDFSPYGSAEMLLGQSGDAPWHEIEHQLKEAIEDSVYSDVFEGVKVDEDLETFEHITDIVEDAFGFENAWTVGLNGFTYNSANYPAAMINWKDLAITHCNNPHQAMVVPLQSNGGPTGYHVLVMPRDCNNDHEISVVLWDFSFE